MGRCFWYMGAIQAKLKNGGGAEGWSAWSTIECHRHATDTDTELNSDVIVSRDDYIEK